MELTWIEISESALKHNLNVFRGLVGKDVILAPTVKANAYGHGLAECARIFEKHGADYLCVNALYEAEKLRKAGIKIPILIIGYTPLSDLEKVIKMEDVELVVYNMETIRKIQKAKMPKGQNAKIHLKIETGNNRQGIQLTDLPEFIKILKQCPNIEVKGVSTHFANLEDRVDQKYALYQLEEFKKAIHILEEGGINPKYRHCANTAAAIVMPEAYFNFARVGIGAYGLWPSEKTEKAAKRAGINIELRPALTWKTIVVQVKDVKKGSFIGYGCTHEMKKDGRIAILPIGYYDGVVRLLSNHGHVLIKGKIAPIIGRICMNMTIVDVTDIPEAKLEDEVVVIGRQGENRITAEEIGELTQTINYEVTTRINERIVRVVKS
jgi:alanine racemase